MEPMRIALIESVLWRLLIVLRYLNSDRSYFFHGWERSPG